ncbi:MAG: hypothetical protein HS130_08120 [Deltaproteobacteria bacterium]|nr:hypothetical protein [Deltaproteobacteria bacterium]
MASMYETLVFFSWTTVLVSAVVIFRYDERETEVITLPVAVLASLLRPRTRNRAAYARPPHRLVPRRIAILLAAYALTAPSPSGHILLEE